MTGNSLLPPIVLLSAAAATQLAVAVSGEGPIRVALGLGFTLLAPGWAILRLIRPPADLFVWVGLSVAISSSLGALIALGLFYARLWSVQLALSILVVIVVAAVAIDIPAVRRKIVDVRAARDDTSESA